MSRPRPTIALAALLLALAALPVSAAPKDVQPGQVRATYARAGTSLHAAPSALGAATSVLPYATRVRVLEVKQPWMRVQAGAKSGWIKTFETVVPAALAASAKPSHVSYAAGVKPDSKEVSAVGRRFDTATEKGFRANRQSLATAYQQVDGMERTTQALDPAESIAFIVEGNLGRVGRDYARPPRLPAEPLRAPRRRGGGGGGKAAAGLVGGVLGHFGVGGGRTGRIVEGAVKGFIEAASDAYGQQLVSRFTRQQEYYLGRAVAAEAIARYGLDKNVVRRHYVRLVGEALVRLSRLVPGNFGGYHFDVLDTDEVNAISGPGGFVLVTRGAVMACRDEAELAGVLAHELSHIALKHGEKLLRQSAQYQQSQRTFLKGLGGAVAGAAAGAGGLPPGTAGALGQLLGKAADQMTQTAVDHAYGRALEQEADMYGTRILYGCYYDHDALRAYLARLATSGHGGSLTHASPAARAQVLATYVPRFKFPYDADEQTRDFQAARFRKATGVTAR